MGLIGEDLRTPMYDYPGQGSASVEQRILDSSISSFLLEWKGGGKSEMKDRVKVGGGSGS